MILVRDIFQLHFGKAREAIEVLKKGQELLKGEGYEVGRLLADVTGDYYTLVMESSYARQSSETPASSAPSKAACSIVAAK